MIKNKSLLNSKLIKILLIIFMCVLLYIFLYALGEYNYLLFHSMAELLGVIPSFMIFIIVIYVWSYLEDNNFLGFIGLAFLFIGIIDLIHTLAYQGMSVFIGYDSNLPTELWIFARYLQVISFLIGCFLINSKQQVKRGPIILIYSIVTIIGLYTIFVSGIFPDSFIMGEGLTSFKIISEYIIIILLLICAVIIWINKSVFTKQIATLLIVSLLIQIMSELSFTTFVNLYGFSNFIGHYLKVIWIFVFFRAILATALLSPSKKIYLDLVDSESKLKNKNEQLQKKINELDLSRVSLLESEQQLSNAIDNAPIPIMLRREDGKILKLSQAWTDITGYSIEDIPTVTSWAEKAYRKDKHTMLDTIRKTYSDDGALLLEDYKVYTKEGIERIWKFNTGNIGMDKAGDKIAMTAALDITDHKKNEIELKEKEERLRLLFECMSEGFIILDILFNDQQSIVDARFVEANVTYRQQINSTKTHVIGALLSDVVTNFQDILVNLEKAMNKEFESNYVEQVDNKFYLLNIFQIGPSRFGLLYTDITLQKEAEFKMLKAKDIAEESSQLKSRFLANMSHEIRTPMNGVIGMIQLMERTELTKEQREIVDISKISSEALLHIINDILDYSKIEAGKLIMQSIEFNIEELVNEVFSLFKSLILEKKLDLKIEFKPNTPIHLKGDPFRLRQVLTNIIGNAIKYTHEGSVSLYIESHKSLDSLNSVYKFSIIDTGIGMDLSQNDNVFSSFTQIDNSKTRTFGGTGLGLAISRKLVKMMNGNIWVESQVGIGSKFFFTCELQEYRSEVIDSTDGHRFGEAEYKINEEDTILLVEDDQTSRLVAHRFLAQRYKKIIIATNGDEAINLYRKHHVDIILMDLQMPVMGGLEATRAIRSMEKNTKRHVPIIAITAYAYEQDKIDCMEAGMDDFISKPVDYDILIEKVFLLLNKE